MTADRNVLITKYIKSLRKASRTLPRPRREELVAEITEYLNEAIPADASETETLDRLARAGDPALIVTEERQRLGLPPQSRGAREWIALIMLLIGGIVLPAVGWVIGLVLLWTSRAWTLRDKLVGTLVPPGGLAASLLLVLLPSPRSSGACSTSTGPDGTLVTHCVGGISTLETILWDFLLLALVLAPIGTLVFLARRARPETEPA